MVTVISRKVKNAESIKSYARERAAKYVYNLYEENSLSDECYISDDGSQASLNEAYVDSDIIMVRFANHGSSPIATEVHQQVEITGLLCCGNAKPDAV